MQVLFVNTTPSNVIAILGYEYRFRQKKKKGKEKKGKQKRVRLWSSIEQHAGFGVVGVGELIEERKAGGLVTLGQSLKVFL